MLWLYALTTAGAAAPWPDDANWIAIGTAQAEPAGDASGPDLAGDPAVAWDADNDTVFFRIGVAIDPTGLDQDIGLLISTDGDPSTYEQAWLVQGVDLDLVVRENLSSNPGPDVVDWGPANVIGNEDSGDTRATPSTIDLQVSRSQLATLGIDDATLLHATSVAALAWPAGWTDVGPTQGPVAIDTDHDGLSEPMERRLGTAPDDADSDDDGVVDLDEASDDNVDGLIDALQCDRDGDGLPDGLELGVTTPLADTAAACFRADTDPTTQTNPNQADTDGGGLSDGVEDADGNGAQSPFEPDPTVASDDVDSDGDGIVDPVDGLVGSIDDVDSDGDGIDDAIEGARDTDGDGTADFADEDSDDDGLPDGVDDLADPDNDGIPNFRDPDADNDGLIDGVEGTGDADDDGRPDFTEEDADDDGFLDGFEGLADGDNDGLRDFEDADADNDSIPDEEERYFDRDGDGIANARDLDSDDDGLLDEFEYDRFTPDFDGDGRADYLDFDTDDDGRLDRDEGSGDDDCDGRPNFRDDDDEDGDCTPAPLDPPGGAAGSPLKRPDAQDPLAQPGSFGGGACRTGASPLHIGLILVAVAVLRRRRLVAACGLAVAPLTAQAQVGTALDAPRFTPSAEASPFWVVERTPLDDRSRHGFAVAGSITGEPFVYRIDDATQPDLALLQTVVTSHLGGWVGTDRAHFGAYLPVHAWVQGFEIDTSPRLGDLDLQGRIRLVGTADALRIGVFGGLRLPTGRPEAWLSAERPVARGGVLLGTSWGPVEVAVRIGGRSRAGDDLGPLSLGPALQWALGAAWTTSPLVVSAELNAEHALTSLGAPGANPVTAHLGVRTHWAVVNPRVALGRGLTGGLGAPAWRMVAGIEVTP
ncbi:MAG: hypothetical protein AAGA48_11195 [Myxococcota bacterium]